MQEIQPHAGGSVPVLAPGCYYQRTGKLGPKINVYFVTRNQSGRIVKWSYKHSTNWHRTCREATEAAVAFYGLSADSLIARKET